MILIKEWLTDYKTMLTMLIALVINLTLFYLDEGIIGFGWAKNPVNWIYFVIYYILIYSGIWLFKQFVVLMQRYLA